MADNTELLQRYRAGDSGAGDMIVEQNMGLVYSVVKRFIGRGCETEDLVQIGAIGLIKAVRKFDTGFGVQFSTYAVPMIAGEIKRFLRDDGVIKVSRSLKENAIKGRRASEQLSKRLGRTPTIGEISAECGIPEDELLAAFEAATQPESLHEGVGDRDDESSMRKLEMIAADENTEEKIVDRVFIKEALSSLSKREQDIIVMRYFRGKTQSEIAGMIGVSQVQVSRIEKKALQRIKAGCEQ